MRTMWDSDNIYSIPTYATMVGYYCDGFAIVPQAEVRKRFPNAILVPISAIGTNDGVVGDVEPGCMTPAYAVSWVRWRRAAGIDPTIYCNQLHGWQPVRNAFHAAGEPEPHYWVANYDNVQNIPPGAVAKQYANPTIVGAHFDVSVVADQWPGVDGLFSGGSGGLGGQDLDATEHQWLQDIGTGVNALAAAVKQLSADLQAVNVTTLGRIEKELQALSVSSGGLTPAQDQLLKDIAAKVGKDLA